MIRRSIVCSICRVEGPVVSFGRHGLKYHQLRKQLREQGWLMIGTDGPHDICPQCREGRTRSELEKLLGRVP